MLRITFNNANGGIRSGQDTTRLDDILQMLHQTQATDTESSENQFVQSVDRCVKRLLSSVGQDVCTLRCFKGFTAALSGTETPHKQRDAEIVVWYAISNYKTRCILSLLGVVTLLIG